MEEIKKEGFMSMTVLAQKIDNVIRTPQKQLSEEEAKNVLIQYGVLSADGKILPAYKEILTKSRKSNGKKQI